MASVAMFQPQGKPVPWRRKTLDQIGVRAEELVLALDESRNHVPLRHRIQFAEFILRQTAQDARREEVA